MNSSGIKRLPNWFALRRNCPSTINYCFLETFLDLFWQLLKFRRTWPSMAILSYWVHFVSLRCVKQTSPQKIHPGNIPEKSIPQPPPAVLKMMIFLFPRICILLVPWRVGLPPQPRKVWGFRTTDQAGKAPRAPTVTGTAATVPATGHSAVGRWWPCRRWRWDLPCSKGKADLKEMNLNYFTKFVWRHLLIYGWFPKMVVFPPNHPISIGFSIIFTIHFGVFPLFLETPIYLEMVDVL